MRVIRFTLLVLCITVSQFGLTYAAAYAACPKAESSQAPKTCCPGHQKASSPSDHCQKACALGQEESPAVTRMTLAQAAKEFCDCGTASAVEWVFLADETGFQKRVMDPSRSGLKLFLLNTSFLI